MDSLKPMAIQIALIKFDGSQNKANMNVRNRYVGKRMIGGDERMRYN